MEFHILGREVKPALPCLAAYQPYCAAGILRSHRPPLTLTRGIHRAPTSPATPRDTANSDLI